MTGQIEKTLYELMGGEEKIHALVDRFYTIMDTAPEAADIRSQHAPDLSEANQKLFEFLSGWTGGPPLFIQKYGHPRLRARHLPFKIGIKERDQWLFCMYRALEETGVSEPALTPLRHALKNLADHMRNQEEA